MKNKFYLILFLLIGCSSPFRGPSAIIGDDNRMIIDPDQYPYQSIGRLNFSYYGANGHCTAVLIHENVILTNAHCIVDKGSKVAHSDFEFIPAYDSGRKPYGSYKLSKVYFPQAYLEGDLQSDYAIARLNGSPGKDLGYYGIKSFQQRWVGQSSLWIVAGYSSNFKKHGNVMTVNRGRCKIHQKTQSILYHDCDTGPGSSGTMVFGTWDRVPYIIGLNFAQYVTNGRGKCKKFKADKCANLAISESKFISDIKTFIKNHTNHSYNANGFHPKK